MARRTWIERRLANGLLIGILVGGAAHGADTGVVRPASLGDPKLGAALRFARGVAANRIADRADCRALFTEQGDNGASLLGRTEYRVAGASEAGGLCARGAVAFTRMGTDRTWICPDGFLRLGRHEGAVVLLHEALHVAGLGEHPHHPGAPTPVEIDRMVKRRCGL